MSSFERYSVRCVPKLECAQFRCKLFRLKAREFIKLRFSVWLVLASGTSVQTSCGVAFPQSMEIYGTWRLCTCEFSSPLVHCCYRLITDLYVVICWPITSSVCCAVGCGRMNFLDTFLTNIKLWSKSMTCNHRTICYPPKFMRRTSFTNCGDGNIEVC